MLLWLDVEWSFVSISLPVIGLPAILADR
jgi:hypothetical protein